MGSPSRSRSGAPMMIPSTLAPFFQEYDLASLDPQTAAPLIFERTLQYGDRAELHWLFAQYPRQQIRDWVMRFGKECLPHPHLDFWQIVLEIQPSVDLDFFSLPSLFRTDCVSE